MTLALTRMMNNARVHLPGAIDSNIQLELFNVLNDFFQNSSCWKEDITFRVTSGVTEYSIENESVATINRLSGVVNSDGFAVGAKMDVPGEIILQNAPSNTETFTATVSLTVLDPVARDGFPEFPAWVLVKYGTGILDGLIGRMMTQSAKPWTNKEMAAFRLKKFTAITSQAAFEAVHGNLANGQTWRFPQSFATRRR
jgi:hypothetical protein